MYQASCLHSLSFDPFAFQQDGLTASEVDVGRGQVVQALVVPLVVVMLDEPSNGGFQIAGHIVVVEQDPFLQCLMPTSPLAGRQAKRRREAILP